jgi:hypothetical protein
MGFKFERGQQVQLDNKYVKVWTGCTRRQENTRFGTTTNGIIIEVTGVKECRIIQVCARLKFDSQSEKFVIQEYDSPSGKRSYTTPDVLKFFVDTEDRKEPYYDVMAYTRGDTYVRTADSLMIWDNPDMGPTDFDDLGDQVGGKYILTQLRQKGDWATFVGLDFCLSDGGLVGIIQWILKRKHGKEAVYKSVKDWREASFISLGRVILREGGYQNAESFIPNNRI